MKQIKGEGMMDIQGLKTPKQGAAVFLPPESSLWDLRQATKQAIRAGKERQPFIVVQNEIYYSGILDQLLRTPSRLQKESLLYSKAITGEEKGCLRCVLLWEDNHEGLLLHSNDGSLLCAYVPVITESLLHKEHELALTLAAIADHAADVPIDLDRNIQPGMYVLRELLHYMSEQMDI